MTWDPEKFVAFDIESSGTLPEYALQPFRVRSGDAWITSWAVADRLTGKLQTRGGLMPDRETLRALLQDWVDRKLTVVGWNIRFDIAWLCAYGLEDLVMQVKWLDGMLLWRHWFIEPEYDTQRHKKKSYSLKPAVAEEFPQYAGYEEEVDFHDPSPAARAKLLKYNRLDTAFTYRLAEKYYNLLAQTPQRLRAALIEAYSLPLVGQANVEGMVVDVAHTQQLYQNLTDEAAKCLAELAPHGVTEKVVRSPKQLAKLLFETWGLPVIKQNTSAKTGNVSDSTDKEVLHELSFIDPRAKVLRQFREALNNQGKFPGALLKSVEYNGDGRTRPEAAVFSTYTGRMTYASKQGKNKDERQTGFALHQMKRGKDFRNEVQAPDGFTIAEFDAAGQEVRWMAIASGDANMLSMCMPGEDLHTFMGAAIGGRDYQEMRAALHTGEVSAKDLRQLGKVANLSCISASNRVLTRRGYVPICQIDPADLLWDGIEWVTHGGVVLNGFKETVSYAGITATPDHLVLTCRGWVQLATAKTEGLEIVSGNAWQGLRGMDGSGGCRGESLGGTVQSVSARVVP